MHKTRQRILELLQQHEHGTVREIADWLAIKLPSLRYHLLALEEEGLIERVPLALSGDAGRPPVVYALTTAGIKALPQCTPWLVKGLLDQLQIHTSSAQLDAAFRDMGHSLAREFVTEPLEDLPLAKRLDAVSKVLSNRGYGASIQTLEKGEHSQVLLQTRVCPYGELPLEHKGLCRLDRELVSELVGQPCTQDQVLALGDDRCTFIISSPDEISLDIA